MTPPRLLGHGWTRCDLFLSLSGPGALATDDASEMLVRYGGMRGGCMLPFQEAGSWPASVP